MRPHHLTLLFAGTLLLPGVTLAEIREIPAEEMTEAYIKDTTVIVRKKKTEENGTGTEVKVKPLADQFSEGESLNANRSDSGGAADNYQAEMINNDLAIRNSTGYDATDPLQAQREAYLRQVLGLDPGAPIDYNKLAFPTNVSTDITPPAGIGSVITPGQFSISIPNNGNYQSQNIQTPGGEYQVNITPSNITFTLNLPQH